MSRRADGTNPNDPTIDDGVRPTGSDVMSALPGWEVPRTDAELAVAATAGDQGAFAAIYDRYADRLFDFCVGMLRDREAAADCVQEVFCTAATRLSQLREPEKLRWWLYAIARSEALRTIKARGRELLADELPEHDASDPGPYALAARTELADLIAEAAGGLSDRDRAVLELAYRHELDGPELAEALGVSATSANTMVGRLRETIERSLGALLVSRHARAVTTAGGSGCPDLAEVLAAWDGEFTVLMRKRIARHIDGCTACDTERRTRVNPATLLAGTPAFIPAPVWLRDHTLTRLTASHVPLPAPGAHPATAQQAGAGHPASGSQLAGPIQPPDLSRSGSHDGSWWPPEEAEPAAFDPVQHDIPTPGLGHCQVEYAPLERKHRVFAALLIATLIFGAMLTVAVLGRRPLTHPSIPAQLHPTGATDQLSPRSADDVPPTAIAPAGGGTANNAGAGVTPTSSAAPTQPKPTSRKPIPTTVTHRNLPTTPPSGGRGAPPSSTGNGDNDGNGEGDRDHPSHNPDHPPTSNPDHPPTTHEPGEGDTGSHGDGPTSTPSVPRPR